MKRTILKKLSWYSTWIIIRATKLFSEEVYKKIYRKKLKKLGMDIAQDNYYIDPTAYFDNYDYSLIHIGKYVTISREVLFLTHDYSLYVGLRANRSKDFSGLLLKDITIEQNCFIGARAILLPGTHIGENSIIGAGTVIKGNIPANSVVIGNPSQTISSSIDMAKRHEYIQDYIRLEEML